jgi:large conductance mechanosensitive channel
LDLAIGIVIGTAFTAVIQSLVDDIITPPLGLILGGVDFVNLTIKMNNFVYKNQPPVVIRYGKFIQSIITLSIVALALFGVIKAINQLYKIAAKKKEKNKTDPIIEASEEVRILCEIRDLLARSSGESRKLSKGGAVQLGTFFTAVAESENIHL